MLRLAVIPEIVARHAEEAAFLWFRRGREIDGQVLGADDIGRIDLRLDANLDGLVAAGLKGWETAQQRFGLFPEPGEVFVLGALALRWGDIAALGVALAAARQVGEPGTVALSGAIARTPRENLRGTAAKWLDSTDRLQRYLGLCALSHHRVDPGGDLVQLMVDADMRIRARAFRLAGELGRRDIAPLVAAGLDAEDDPERFQAALALCLLGEARLAHSVLDGLCRHATLGRHAVELRLLTTPGQAGKRWLQGLLEQADQRAAATTAIGLVGDRAIMPWLTRAMREPALARAAAIALRDLFAIDFDDTSLFSIDPALFGKDMAELLEEGALPVADRVSAWWDRTRGEGLPPFHSMRRLRLDALRATLADPDRPLDNWRRTRRFAAWI